MESNPDLKTNESVLSNHNVLADGPGIFPPSDEERIIALGPSSSSKKRLMQAFKGEHDALGLFQIDICTHPS